MKNIKSILIMAKNLFFYEWSEKRVIMGFLVGMVTPFYWLKNFLNYAVSTGEPVNILEAFLVIEHEGGSILFLTLGWLLVVSDAPFVNGNTYYSLYRTKKRSWNSAMVCYIFVQAAFYTILSALPAVLISLPYGFKGKMWSNPVYMLSLDIEQGPGAEYGISFLHQNMMRRMNVPQTFAAALLCLFLYLAVTGVILYTLSLPFGSVRGLIITFMVQIGRASCRERV